MSDYGSRGPEQQGVINQILGKLAVGGSKPLWAPIDWVVDGVEDPFQQRAAEFQLGLAFGRPFHLSLRWRGKEFEHSLSYDDVATKGCSIWEKNNVWRLTSSAITELVPKITGIVVRTLDKWEKTPFWEVSFWREWGTPCSPHQYRYRAATAEQARLELTRTDPHCCHKTSHT